MTAARYSNTSIFLHWAIALLVIANLTIGLSMDQIPKESMRSVMGTHKAIGVTVLVLTLWRILVRLRTGFLPLPAHTSPFERVVARLSHLLFYVLLLALPLTGWIMSSAAGRSISWFGLFNWPLLPIQGSPLGKVADELHGPLGYAMLALVLLHVAGALKHQLIDRDNLLARMLPGRS